MKKLFIISSLLFFAHFVQAQIVKIDIDSLVEGSTVVSKKWNGKADSVRVIEVKTFTVYGDSTSGNVTMVLEWKLDTVKAVKIREDIIVAEKRKRLKELQQALDDFKLKNADALKPSAAKINTVIPATRTLIEEPPKPKNPKPKPKN